VLLYARCFEFLDQILNLRSNRVEHEVVTFLFCLPVHREDFLTFRGLEHFVEQAKLFGIGFEIEESLVDNISCAFLIREITLLQIRVRVSIDDLLSIFIAKKLNKALNTLD
jgi:hypothetical protein